MKRALSIFMLCSLLLLITVGIAKAGNPDYSILEYACVEPATIDGEWTTWDEWLDAPITMISDNAYFAYDIEMGTLVVEWLVEISDDNTTDAEDYWQICLDDMNTGGTAPQIGDFKIEVVGHTDLVCYEGDGTGWTVYTPVEDEIAWANSISASAWNSEPHWILELSLIKTIAMIPTQPPTGMRVAVYDASNSEAGVQAWAPDSDPDVPDEWGLIETYSMDPIPEGLTFPVMVFLSSVSLLTSSLYLRKRSKKREKQ